MIFCWEKFECGVISGVNEKLLVMVVRRSFCANGNDTPVAESSPLATGDFLREGAALWDPIQNYRKLKDRKRKYVQR